MKAILTGFLLMAAIGSVMAGPPSTLPEQLLEQYYSIQKSLASDSINDIAASAAQIASISRKAAATEPRVQTQIACPCRCGDKNSGSRPEISSRRIRRIERQDDRIFAGNRHEEKSPLSVLLSHGQKELAAAEQGNAQSLLMAAQCSHAGS